MSADSPRRAGASSRGLVAVPTVVPPQVVSDRSILDSAIGFINEVTLAHQPLTDPKDTITWARFETAADISDPRFGEDWELEGNVAPPLLLILGYGLGVQVWAIPANGEAVEVLSWRHGIVSALRVLPTPSTGLAVEDNGRADEPIDAFAEKRPLIALVDGSASSGAQPQFCSVNFISLKTGSQVKAIKFKNPVIDILANRSSIVITFHERIAIFDARTLEDRLSITTCYPSPGINPNPVALGPRWLAYAEHKLIHSKRSGGGCDGEGVASYKATVLNASKSLVKGLRELGEQVAAGLTGTSGSGTSSKNASFDSGSGPDSKQSGVVTIIDIKNPLRDYSPTSGLPMTSSSSAGTDPIVAHFIAHSEALVAMEFDNSGMLLVTADRRGHDFHVFRVQANPVGPSLAAVHHLYVLHRGDTSAKVQNISFSLDSRWVAVSTLRGTTHVFPITPYGGAMGVRTHTSLHVVNKLSRFHRSAGLSAEGRSSSPISHSESTTFSLALQPYHNPTLPPYPRPTVVMPLAQLRQPFALGSPPGSATLPGGVKTGPGGQPAGSQRQRLSSLSDDSGKPLSVCAIFAKSRSWLLDPPNVTREAPHRMQRKAVDSLFVMAGHGALIQYDLDTKLASNVAKEKICDDTPIELEVEAKAQWDLGRRKEGSQEIMPPLCGDNWLVRSRNSCMLTDSTRQYDESEERSESWLAQVEIVTHAGPHRRLWMGPQFVFKTYNTPSGSNLSHVDAEAVEIGTAKAATSAASSKPEHSTTLNMPMTAAGRSSAVPVLIESGSYSSIEQSPKLMDRFRHDHLDSDYSVAHGDTRLKEDLADAMRESPSVSAAAKDGGGRGCDTAAGCSNDNIAFYDALAEHEEQQEHDLTAPLPPSRSREQQQQELKVKRNASAAALASALPNIYSYDHYSSYESLESLKKPKASIEKIVNPLGTVTTVTSCMTADVKTDILDEVVSQLAAEDTVIHENCDESLFRPVVAIFCDEKTRLQQQEDERKQQELCQPPEEIGNKLVVPVIAKEVDDELSRKERRQKGSPSRAASLCQPPKEGAQLPPEQSRFEELRSMNRNAKTEVEKSQSVQTDHIKTETSKKQSMREPKNEVTLKQVKMGNIVTELAATDTKQVCIGESKKGSEVGDGKSSSTSKPTVVLKKTVLKEPISKEQPALEVAVKKQEVTKLDIDESAASANTAKIKEVLPECVSKDEMSSKTKTTFTKPTSKVKQSTPERESSPKPTAEKAKFAATDDGLAAEAAIEFKRMTPLKKEEVAVQKPLSKKELKRQQQQKALEESKKEIQKDKKVKDEKPEKNEEKRESSERELPKSTKDPVKNENDKMSKDLETSPAKEVTKESKQLNPFSSSKDSESTAKDLGIKRDSITSTKSLELKTLRSDSRDMEKPKKEEPVIAVKETVTTKTAITAEKEKSSTSESVISKNPEISTKTIIKTEQLDITNLTDSLMELKEDSGKDTIQADKKAKDTASDPLPMEAVEIFASPPPVKIVGKKTKKKAMKSSSNSESEDVVDITKSSSSSDDQNITLKKKSSLSSECSSTDLADSLLDRKDHDLQSSMFVSFSQTQERSTGDKQEKSAQNVSLEAVETKHDFAKSIEPLREKKTARKASLEELETKVDFNKSKEPLTLKKTSARPKEVILDTEEKNRNETVKQEKTSLTIEQKKSNLKLKTSKDLEAEEDEIRVRKLPEKAVKAIPQNEPKLEEKKPSNVEPLKSEKSAEKSENLKKEDETLTANAKKTSAMPKTLAEGIVQKDSSDSSNLKKEKFQLDKEPECTQQFDTKQKLTTKPAKLGTSKEITACRRKSDEMAIEGSTISDDIKQKLIKNETNTEKKVSLTKKSESLQKAGEKLPMKIENVQEITAGSLVEVGTKLIKDSMATDSPKQPILDKKDFTKGSGKPGMAKQICTTTKENEKEKLAITSEKLIPNPTESAPKPNKSDTKSSSSNLEQEQQVVVEQPRKQIVKNAKLKQGKELAADYSEKVIVASTTPPSSPQKKPIAKDVLCASTKAELETSKQAVEETSMNPKTSMAANCKQQKDEDTSKPINIYKVKVTETQPKAAIVKPLAGSPVKSNVTNLPSSSVPVPVVSAWKALSGADMIAASLKKQAPEQEETQFPSLGAVVKTSKVSAAEKLLPELPTPKESKTTAAKSLPLSSVKKSKNASVLEDIPILQPLETLPPLPALEPLELLSGDKPGSTTKDISLINFESPLQENPALERKITPPPRGFTEQNLIFALCGSLHYENEQRPPAQQGTSERLDLTPTTPSSSNRSSSALDEPSMADYKSLTENDDPYISLEQSSQDTNTTNTNTNTTNEKFSSSSNSSGSEEIIIMEEKKMTKKQKRKRQQQLQELQKQKEMQMQEQQPNSELEDEELRPLIAMSESQLDAIAVQAPVGLTLPSLLDDSFSMKPLIMQKNTLNQSTTTDSEGPMPATTSDDNVFVVPSSSSHTQHKIKTKKLEQKFNLIAAIEAATSSSTSSAEESGVEQGGGSGIGGLRGHDPDAGLPSLAPTLLSAADLSSAASVSPGLPLAMPSAGGVRAVSPIATLSASAAGALKKKTRRRKR